MCLLVNQPASTVFTEDFIADVFQKNGDGFGVMYAEKGKLHVYKCLPTSAADMYQFYRAHAEGRDCVWHARMQTHGDIDLDNCHPYRVTDDIWLAHNGILSTGNAADKTKSDTWHFIHNVIQPALSHNPDLMLDEAWQKMIGHIIGSGNKFGLVRADGKTVIINEQSGVNFVGAWLSNTYAWSTTKFGFRSSYQTQGYNGYGYGGTVYDNEAYGGWWAGKGYKEDEGQDTKGTPTTTKSSVVHGYWEKEDKAAKGALAREIVDYTPQQIRPMIRAAYNTWMRNGIAGLENWCKSAPYKAAAVIGYWYDELAGEDLDTMIQQDPEEAATWIEDLFNTDSIQPSMLS